MPDRIILDGTTSLELSAKGAGSDVRSWVRDRVGQQGARLFLNSIAEPGDVDTIINLRRGNVCIGTTEARAKLTVTAAGFESAIQTRAGRGDGVRGESDSGHGVSGISNTHTGTEGGSSSGIGVHGLSSAGPGVRGESNSGPGMVAMSISGNNVLEARVVNTLVFAVQRNGTVLADGPFTGPADFAETLPAGGLPADYEAGDVLAIGKDGKLAVTEQAQSTAVAGVYSARPGFVGDSRLAARGLEPASESEQVTDGETWVTVAVVGVVPVKASAENGAISPGDLLVSATTAGHAMRAEPIDVGGHAFYPTGAILGKALEALDAGSGLIKILLTQR
jgi:hypothetical protein